MKKILLVVLAISSVIPAFAGHRKHKKKKSAPPVIESVTMHRTACYGHCPEYMIEITREGVCTYTAMRFTDDTGVFRKNIGKEQAMQIINELQANRADTCKDLYDNRIPDAPGLKYIIAYKGMTKSISNANFGPSFLMNTSRDMDKIGRKTADNNDGWTKITITPGKK